MSEDETPKADMQHVRKWKRRRKKIHGPMAEPTAGPRTTLLPLQSIEIGEPDANAEYFISQRTKSLPLY